MIFTTLTDRGSVAIRRLCLRTSNEASSHKARTQLGKNYGLYHKMEIYPAKPATKFEITRSIQTSTSTSWRRSPQTTWTSIKKNIESKMSEMNVWFLMVSLNSAASAQIVQRITRSIRRRKQTTLISSIRLTWIIACCSMDKLIRTAKPYKVQ